MVPELSLKALPQNVNMGTTPTRNFGVPRSDVIR